MAETSCPSLPGRNGDSTHNGQSPLRLSILARNSFFGGGSLSVTLCRSRPSVRAELKSICPGSRSVKQRGFLLGAASRGDLLERVPQHRVRARRLVDREIALEHAALRPEFVDGVQ